MPTNPNTFASFFLAQPYPTMGMAPSAAPTRTGGTVVQNGGNRLGETAQTMWARIASAVPFGWTLGGVANSTQAAQKVAAVAKAKTVEGAQAVEGKVESAKSSISGFLQGYVSYTKWVVVGIVIVGVLFLFAQVKTLVRN